MVVNGWLVCPYCKKKLYPVKPSTVIIDKPDKCKNSNCKQEFTTNIQPNT